MWAAAWRAGAGGARGARLGHHMRGKPPGEARSLQQRLAELRRCDPLYAQRTDIGLPQPRKSRMQESAARLVHIKNQKADKTLEKLARNVKLLVNTDEVREDWLITNGPLQMKLIADHYGIYEHLYGEGYFVPRVNLDIAYPQGNDAVLPVFYGNVIKPSEAKETPIVTYMSDKESLWTLVLTSLDGHLQEADKEYVHWFVANIPGNDVNNGETLVEYLQPIPPRGTGFHRYVFVLYKQNDRIAYDLTKLQATSPLASRTFVTRDWYRQYEDSVTPAGLAFYQADWDTSLTQFYHEVLNMKEPVYEYDFPEPYIRPQEWFPLRKPFNIYMDKYRDPKQINKEYLIRKLKNENPFRKPDSPLKFPNAHAFPRGTPSWHLLHEKKIRLGWGRVNDV